MRWLRYPIALAAGLGLAVLVAASSATSICPTHYTPTHRHHVLLCTRVVTTSHTVTHLVAAAPTPARTVIVPTTLTQTVPGPTTTQTITVAATRTITSVSTETQTETQTTTVQAPPVTTTVTVTQPATTAPVSLTFCGGYGGNWSSGNCDPPPSPLSAPSGSRVELAALAQRGADTGLGCLTFTVPIHPVAAIWSEYDQEYGLNPAASHDCSCVENFSGQASGACLYTFGTVGAYEVSVAAATATPITTNVQVG